jgi:HTH-type transcriptional regulator/antitoxin HigA
LAEILDYLADQIRIYEDAHVKIPDAAPRDILRFLMQQHGLKQSDLADCVPQSHVSAILNGKRGISKDVAKALAKRFHVKADVFLYAIRKLD